MNEQLSHLVQINLDQGAGEPPPIPPTAPPAPPVIPPLPPPLIKREGGVDERGSGSQPPPLINPARATSQTNAGPKKGTAKSGVFVNGRELDFWEAAPIRWTLGQWRGRFWKDEAGNIGLEGQPALGNLKQMALQKVATAAAISVAQAALASAAQRAAPNGGSSGNGNWLIGGGSVIDTGDGLSFIDHEGRCAHS